VPALLCAGGKLLYIKLPYTKLSYTKLSYI